MSSGGSALLLILLGRLGDEDDLVTKRVPRALGVHYSTGCSGLIAYQIMAGVFMREWPLFRIAVIQINMKTIS